VYKTWFLRNSYLSTCYRDNYDLLGAGASAPFGINTSKELTDLMRTKIESKKPGLLSEIDKFYKEYGDLEPDFETMLTQLTAYTNPAQVDSPHNSLIFARMHTKFKDDYSLLIDEMYKEVCKTCTSPFIKGTNNYLEPEKLEEVFTKTYDVLFGAPSAFSFLSEFISSSSSSGAGVHHVSGRSGYISCRGSTQD